MDVKIVIDKNTGDKYEVHHGAFFYKVSAGGGLTTVDKLPAGCLDVAPEEKPVKVEKKVVVEEPAFVEDEPVMEVKKEEKKDSKKKKW